MGDKEEAKSCKMENDLKMFMYLYLFCKEEEKKNAHQWDKLLVVSQIILDLHHQVEYEKGNLSYIMKMHNPAQHEVKRSIYLLAKCDVKARLLPLNTTWGQRKSLGAWEREKEPWRERKALHFTAKSGTCAALQNLAPASLHLLCPYFFFLIQPLKRQAK